MTTTRSPILHQCSCLFMVLSLLSLTFTDFAFANTDPAFIKTELKKNEKTWPGQRQTLYVKLYTTTSFSGSTRFELPKVSGMLIMESEDRPLLGTEKIDGVSYIFKQHEITLFPQYAGSMTVPPFSVEFGYRGAENKLVEKSFSTHELQFTVAEIPGADPKRVVITTTNLHIDDRWEPVPEKAKVGDAFTRIITMTADDLPGMAFPPFNAGRIEGLGVYTKPAQVADKMQRGAFTGKRIETISYVCEQKGLFTIAETQVQWWNPKSESLQNIVLKGVELEVAANPLLQKESPVGSNVFEENLRSSWKWPLLILLFAVLVAAVVVLQIRRIQKQRPLVLDMENDLFKEFQQVSASGDAKATMLALLHWLDYSNFTGNSGRISAFVKLAADSELSTQVENLETTLYAGGQDKTWSGDRLYIRVQRARKKLKHQKSHAVQYVLPALNP